MFKRLSLLSVFLLLCMISATTFAGTIQLPQTGQTKCYEINLYGEYYEIPCSGTGQDGEIQTGVAWPNPRFVDIGDGTVTDKLTGLMWTKDAGTPTVGKCTGGTKNWSDALDYVSCLNSVNHFGYGDWRLPNKNELQSLLEYSDNFVTYQYFINLVGQYWSSSSSTSYPEYAWYVYLVNSGTVSLTGKSATLFVLPVRSGNYGGGVRLPKTGQTESYKIGDDGYFEKGVSWPNPRFVDIGDGTVTDKLTGLMWTKDAGTPTVNNCSGGNSGSFGSFRWQEALNYVKCLNSIPYLGHSNWRLPNIIELQSLVDISRQNQALPLGHPFINMLLSYWSSTTDIPFGTWSCYVNMSSGLLDREMKLAPTKGVWPMRDGQVEPNANYVYPVDGIEYVSCPVDTGTEYDEANPSTWYTMVWTGKYAGDAQNRCEGSGGHPGVDILPRTQEAYNIKAIGDDATVIERNYLRDWGNYIILEHTNDPTYGTFYSIYAHLASIDSSVQEGQPVTAGQTIGIMGSTGASTGTHLHFQLDRYLSPVTNRKGVISYYKPYWTTYNVYSKNGRSWKPVSYSQNDGNLTNEQLLEITENIMFHTINPIWFIEQR